MFEEKLEKIKSYFLKLENDLTKVLPSDPQYKKIVKEYNRLKPLIEKYNQYSDYENKLIELKKIIETETDKELKNIAIEELKSAELKSKKIVEEIRSELISAEDPLSSRNIILEIRAGAGGEEAAIFAADLFRMYQRFAEKKNWRTEPISFHPTDLGGYKEIIVSIQGENVYRYLKYESGVHRVQRVPITEASGRIHTSTASVAILPEPEEIEVQINENELKIETFRSSGPGGQHMQKTESAVRILHIPTGIVVQCQDERSQLKNKEKAMKVLRAKLYEKKIEEQLTMISSKRKEQIKSAERSEKIRTYNFPQNRVTDHRINLSVYNLKYVLDGNLDEIIKSLQVGLTE